MTFKYPVNSMEKNNKISRRVEGLGLNQQIKGQHDRCYKLPHSNISTCLTSADIAGRA